MNSLTKTRIFLSQYWERHPLRSVLLLGLVVRLLAAIFSKGYAFNDDHFSIIAPIQAWMDGYPMWGNPDIPPTHSLIYVFSQYVFFKLFYFVGIEDPHSKMLGIRIIHALFSVLTVYYGYKLTEKISDQKNARSVGMLLALFWLWPFVSVRNLVEIVCVPFILAGFIHLIQAADQKTYDWKGWALAGLLFGFAFSIRYHTILIAGGAGLVMLYRRQWRGAIVFSLAYLVMTFFSTGIIDWILYRYPYHSVVYYYQYNVDVAYNMITLPAWNYLLVLLALLGPPISLWFLFGFGRGFKIEPMIFLGCIAFFLWHSGFPHKQERFIFPIVPLVIILGFLGWQQYVQKSQFWTRHKSWLKGGWIYFWIVNSLFLLAMTFSSVHLGRANSMYYFYGKDDVSSIVVHHSNTNWRFSPIYYMGKTIPRWETLSTDRDFLWHYVLESKEYLDPDFPILFNTSSSDSIPSLIKTMSGVNKRPNYILIKGLSGHEAKRDRWEKEYAPLELLAEIKPSNLDRVMNFLNPRHNPDDHYFVYRAKVEELRNSDR